MAFSNEQLERYSRHIILKEVGAKGQKKLLNAKVLIIGAGGLGAPAAMYLAAAGVGMQTRLISQIFKDRLSTQHRISASLRLSRQRKQWRLSTPMLP